MMRLRQMILVAGLALAVPASAAEPVAGRWLMAEKDAVILIAPCGKTMCGTIEKFLVPPPQGNDQRDVNNPDPGKRKRRLLVRRIQGEDKTKKDENLNQFTLHPSTLLRFPRTRNAA